MHANTNQVGSRGACAWRSACSYLMLLVVGLLPMRAASADERGPATRPATPEQSEHPAEPHWRIASLQEWLHDTFERASRASLPTAEVQRWLASMIAAVEQGEGARAVRVWLNPPVHLYEGAHVPEPRVLVLIEAGQPAVQVNEYRGAVLSDQDILLFVEAGRPAIPLLIEYVTDQRASPYFYHYPTSSMFVGEVIPVGKLACYLIEATLREEPYFTRTMQLDPESGASDEDLAEIYLNWFKRCYDVRAKTWVCWNLPEAPWQIDPHPRKILRHHPGASNASATAPSEPAVEQRERESSARRSEEGASDVDEAVP
jgi:hypothetical protein